MTDLHGQALEPTGGDGHLCNHLGVAITRDHLGGHGLAVQAQLVHHLGFHARLEHGVGAHGAAQLAVGDLLVGAGEALFVPLALKREAGQAQAEGGGLGVHAVGAAHAQGVAVLDRAGLQRLRQRLLALDEDLPALHHGQCQPRVEHVAAGHAVVHPAAGRADVLVHVGEEGHHVVVGGLLDLQRALHAERGLGLDLVQVVSRDHPTAGPCTAHGKLDVEPALQLCVVGPDGGHLGPRIPRDHASIPVAGSRATLPMGSTAEVCAVVTAPRTFRHRHDRRVNTH